MIGPLIDSVLTFKFNVFFFYPDQAHFQTNVFPSMRHVCQFAAFDY